MMQQDPAQRAREWFAERGITKPTRGDVRRAIAELSKPPSPAVEPAAPANTGGYVDAVQRGFMGTVAGALEGLSVAASKVNEYLPEFAKDKPEDLGIPRVSGALRERIAAPENQPAPGKEGTLGNIAEGVGSALGFAATMVGGGGPIAATARAAGMGFLSEAGPAYFDTLAKTGSDDDAWRAYLLHGAGGATEGLTGAVPAIGRIGRILSSMNKSSGGAITRGLAATIAKGAAEEWAQNTGQALWFAAADKYFLEHPTEARDWLAITKDAAITQGIPALAVGGLFGGVEVAAQRAVSAVAPAQEEAATPPAEPVAGVAAPVQPEAQVAPVVHPGAAQEAAPGATALPPVMTEPSSMGVGPTVGGLQGVAGVPVSPRVFEAPMSEDAGGVATPPPAEPVVPASPEPAAPAPTASGVVPETKLDYFVRRVQDKFRHVLTVQKAVGAGEQEPTPTNVYAAEERYYGRKAAELGDRGYVETKFLRPIARTLRKGGISQQEAGDFLYALSVPKRNEAIFLKSEGKVTNGSGWEGGEEAADAFVKARLEGPQGDKFRKLQEINRAINERKLAYMRKLGTLSPEQSFAWEETYGKDYVPLLNDDEDAMRLGRGFSIQGPESFKAKGRFSEAANPLVWQLAKYSEAIDRAERTVVAQHAARFVEAHPDANLGEVFTPKNYEEELRARQQPNFVGYKEGGQQRFLVLRDEKFASALQNLGEQKVEGLMAGVARATRLLAKMSTTWDPEFIISNFSRDLQTAGIHLSGERSLKMARKVLGGLRESYRAAWAAERGKPLDTEHAKYLEEAKVNGGITGWSQASGFGDVQKSLESLGKLEIPQTATEKAYKWMYVAGELVSDWNGAVEQSVRLSAYVEARKSGMSIEQAASLMKNLTVNFNRRGEMGAWVNAGWMFFNAGVQGSARVFRAAKNPTVRKIMYGIAAAGFAEDTLNRKLGGDDDDGVPFYDKIPEYVKDRNWVFILPDDIADSLPFVESDGGVKYLKIPMPWGYNALHTVGRNLASAMDNIDRGGKAGITPAKALQSSMGSILNALNPMGETTSLLQFAAPTVADPFIQVAENKSWTGAPVKPMTFPGEITSQSEKAWKTTSAPAKEVATFLNEITGGDKYKGGWADVSPAVIDHFAGFAAGGAGRLAGRAIGVATNPDQPLSGTPGMRRLFGELDQRWDQQKFFDNLKEVDIAVKRMKETGERDPLVALKQRANFEERVMTRLRKQRDLLPDGEAKKDVELTMANRMRAFNGAVLSTLYGPRSAVEPKMIPSGARSYDPQRKP